MTDEQLTVAHVQGDRDAFATLVERYRDKLKKFIERAGSNDADDVVQRALIKAHQQIGDFDAEKMTFRQWLFMLTAGCRA